LKSASRSPKGGGPPGRIVGRERLGPDGCKEGKSIPLCHPEGDGAIKPLVQQKPSQVAIVIVVVVGIGNYGAVWDARRPFPDPVDASECTPKVPAKKGLHKPADGIHGTSETE
jgi:hypothetical protein